MVIDIPAASLAEAAAEQSLDRQRWITEQSEDPHISAIKDSLTLERVPATPSMATWVSARIDSFLMIDGLVHFVENVRQGSDRSTRVRLAVPQTMRRSIMEAFHASQFQGGHFGSLRTMGSIAQHFWWPRLYSDVHDFVAGCIKCQTVGKAGVQKAIIGGHVVGLSPFEYMAMDLLAMPSSTAGNHYILVVMDYFSRYAITAPLPDKTAGSIAKAFIDHVVLVYGPPENSCPTTAQSSGTSSWQRYAQCFVPTARSRPHTTPSAMAWWRDSTALS